MKQPVTASVSNGDATGDPVRMWLQLYISGATPRSTRAIANITKIAEKWLPGRYDLEVIDAFQQAELLRDQQIVVLPTLIKRSRPPKRRVVGDLSDHERVVLGLGLGLDVPHSGEP
jgi:circadian clock protein KaiB